MSERSGLGKKKKGLGAMSNIYILHGWTTDRKDGVDPLAKWHDFLEELTTQKYSALLLQVPGLTTDLDKVFNLETYVEWLNKTLRNEKQVILIGHSNGGRIISAFQAKYPEKVAKLILIDSAGIYHNELPIRLKRTIFKALAKIGKSIFKSETLKKLLYKVVRERDYQDATKAQKKTMLNMIKSDLTETFKQIKTPTLIIWGENDQQTPLKDGLLIHKLIPNSQMHIINEARHSPMFTHTREVIKIISDFL